MFNYLRASFRRKLARRITQEYPAKVDTFDLKELGKVQFANWENPLVSPSNLQYPIIAFFKQFIKEGDFAIDIGTNIGDTTVPMGLCTGASGLTLGFDPNPYVFKILAKNATLNEGKMNIVPLPYAVSKEEEEFYFISSEASFANGGISPTKNSKHGRFIYPDKVKGVNLQIFLEQNYNNWLPKLSLIKIDAEGYDKEIIKSISHLISKYKPIVIAESFGNATNAEKIELYEVIDRLDYEIYYFADFTAEAKVEKLGSKTDMIKWKDTINIYGRPR